MPRLHDRVKLHIDNYPEALYGTIIDIVPAYDYDGVRVSKHHAIRLDEIITDPDSGYRTNHIVRREDEFEVISE